MPGDPPRIHWLCIGAQKAGTSTLFELLRDHPEIAVPASKEDPLFDRDVDDAAVAAYLVDRFAEAPEGARCGTVTPQYLSDPATAARVATYCPGVRVVVLLRDPVARAFSHWQMSTRRGLDRRPFPAAVAEQLRVPEPDWFHNARDETGTYVERGRYATLLAPWVAELGRDRVHVELTADLQRDQAAVLDRVQRFLEVEPRPVADTVVRAHEAAPSHLLSGARRPVASLLRRVGLLQRLDPERKQRLATSIERALGAVAPRPSVPLDDETERLLRAAYADDGARLPSLLGLDPPWP